MRRIYNIVLDNKSINSVPLEGKDTAVQINTVELLVTLLSSSHEIVQAKAAGAIMMFVYVTNCNLKSMDDLYLCMRVFADAGCNMTLPFLYI